MATKQQELVVKITADASDATKAIAQLDKAAKPLEDGIKVPVKLDGADKAASQLDQAATAGKRLGVVVNGIDAGHVRDLDGPAKVAAAVLGEVETAAERADKALEDVDSGGGGLPEVGDNAERTADQVKTLERSAGGAKNAFANLVGNTAQDLGELGGPLGSIGVALGQVAEYTADAANEGGGLTAALSGAASMAGPLIALAVAGAAVSKVVGDMKRTSEEAKAANEAYGKALVESTGSLEGWGKGLDDAFNAGTTSQVEDFTKVIKDTLKATGDLDKTTTAMGQLGLSADDLGASIAGADDNFTAWSKNLLLSRGYSEQAAEALTFVVDNNEKLGDVLRSVGPMVGKFLTPDQAANVKDYATALAQLKDVVEKLDTEKKAKDFLDLQRAIPGMADAVDKARASTSTERAAAAELTVEIHRQVEARDANARAAEEGAAAAEAAGSILDQVGRQEAEAADAAADAMDRAKAAQDNWLTQNVDYEASVDGFTESLQKLTEQTEKQVKAGDEGAGSFEGNTKAALDNRDALRDVYSKATDVIQGMKDAGFSVDGARTAQDNMAQSAYDLAIQMGYPIAKAEEIRDKIKAIPPSVTSEVAITEQGYSDVKAKKDDLEQDMESTLFINGVLDRSVLDAVAALPPGAFGRSVAPSTSSTSPAVAARGVAVAPEAGLAAPMALAVPARSAPSVTRTVAVHVNVSAGIVADTFQLQRVVERATRQAARLGGTRP